jgi:CheY-like chemotaxis protein
MQSGTPVVAGAHRGRGAGAGPRPAAPGSGAAQGEGPALLVVEDAPLIRELLATVFAHAGYQVTALESALGALDLIRRLRPVAVVLDLGLPYVSGAHLLAELRADPDPAVRRVPVVIVTAYADALTDERRAQADAVLDKPVRLRDLVAAVRSAAAGARAG